MSSEEDGYLDSKEMDYLSDSSSSSEGWGDVLLMHLSMSRLGGGGGSLFDTG